MIFTLLNVCRVSIRCKWMAICLFKLECLYFCPQMTELTEQQLQKVFTCIHWLSFFTLTPSLLPLSFYLSLSLFFSQVKSVLLHGPGLEVLSQKFNISIKRDDVRTLAGLNWLNDEVMISQILVL